MNTGRPIVDLVGNRFSKLLGLKFSHQGKGGLAYFVFKCDCGKLKTLCGTEVSRGRIKSCGCFHHKWPLPQTRPIGAAAAHMLYMTYKYEATHNRSLAFELSEEKFLKITKLPCSYCGVLPEKEYRGTSKNSSPYLYNGIDRVDNSKGYIATNVCPCCAVCNQAKHSMSLDKFMRWIKRLVEFQTRESDAKCIGTGTTA